MSWNLIHVCNIYPAFFLKKIVSETKVSKQSSLIGLELHHVIWLHDFNRHHHGAVEGKPAKEQTTRMSSETVLI